jgi:beta-lactamase superfamily II metal-dependent hydrolase
MKTGDIVYFAKTKASVTPIGPASNLKESKPKVALLWGDQMYVVAVDGGKVTVSAKGHKLSLRAADVMSTPLLSLYQIDCGQGDAALVHTPDDRWMMIDGGPSPGMANSPAVGTQFLFWKLFVDQSWRKEFKVPGPFKLDALIVTHPDEDHFGGFTRVINTVTPGGFEIGTIFHNGMGRFGGAPMSYDSEAGSGFSQLGPINGQALPDAFLTTLLNDAADIAAFASPAADRTWTLTGNYATFLKAAAAKIGQGIGAIQRVDHTTGHLPGYAPGAGVAACRVLGPVVEKIGAHRGLRFLDSAGNADGPSLTRNGHSIVLRFDYDKFRLLMTGDLNFNSHAVLLENVPKEEFACHVAKACHHGAEDISHTFLAAMNPLATLFSSGDNEAYAHPRAKALAFSARFSQILKTKRKNTFLTLSEPEHVAPLIYSTELSRSVDLFSVQAVLDAAGKPVPRAQIQPKSRSQAAAPKHPPAQPAKNWYISSKLVYGLINVRTDGKRVVIAVLKEDDESFQVEEFTL